MSKKLRNQEKQIVPFSRKQFFFKHPVLHQTSDILIWTTVSMVLQDKVSRGKYTGIFTGVMVGSFMQDAVIAIQCLYSIVCITYIQYVRKIYMNIHKSADGEFMQDAVIAILYSMKCIAYISSICESNINRSVFQPVSTIPPS